MKSLQMAGSSQKDKTKLDVFIQHECLANLLPLEIWSIIALMVASNSIEDLFNMQATCRLFASACNSDAVYRHALVSVLPIACFLDYSGTPAMTFLRRCARARNPAAMLRVRMSHLFWCGHRRGGIRTLTEAAELGDVEACYISAMLLLSLGDKTDDEIRRGFEFFCVVRESGAVKRCREVFTQMFAGPWSDIPPADPKEPVSCRSGSFRTRGTIGDESDLSSVACVQCLAEYEVRKCLGTYCV
ncbi:putative F-box protein At1g67623 [Arachis ipaensis]|uniref:At2g35280-like TPR domain-containing protein n=1 Tax=Arachis hypogaea TaxID=3818 RepID=A0A445ADJ6_ARAHY|nr:putative F-box protein At1g67623 [Arachis ipaensis]XP_025635603.1 putative F-box protein At1g67623 [Arachis hypogaea]RYR24493.1 hypothetical protein Ahy_B02g057996 [Arachis hypogaea]